MARIQSQQQRLQAGAAPIATPISIPSPVKGWNSRDEFDAMDPLDAVQLDNWFPDAGGVTIRNGYTTFATGLGSAPVATVATLSAGGANKMVAACGGKIFDVSTGGSVGAAIGAGFTSDWWQSANFLKRLFLVNGADPAQIYDGTTLSAASFTGVTTSTLVGVWQYQQRLFFWQANSTGFWYALLNSMSGALAFYDLSAFCPRGGNLVAMTTTSYDGGNGVVDYVAFLMSSGDALLFQGNDPSLSSNWSLVGEYRLSPPVSQRAVTDYGGDSFVTTYDDHVTLQQMFTALRLGEMAPRSKVSKAVQLAVQSNKAANGWQALYYPRGRSLIFNIPNADGSFSQHICNTGLPDQPWCRYTGQNAYCWAVYNDLLYFGGAVGTVYQADTGSLDGLGAIVATAQQSWNKVGNAQRKRVTAIRPLVQSLGAMSYSFSMGFDYSNLNISVPIVTAGVGSPWDTSAWDVSPWSTDYNVSTSWRVGGGSGTSVGFGLSVISSQTVTWLRTDLRLEGGNAL